MAGPVQNRTGEGRLLPEPAPVRAAGLDGSDVMLDEQRIRCHDRILLHHFLSDEAPHRVQFRRSIRHGLDPDTAFRIEGADRLYSRAAEIRWSLENDTLTIQTTRNDRYAVTVLSDDVVRLGDTYYGTMRLLFRTGSEASRAMVEFRDCVNGNKRRNLFEVQQCRNPLPASE